MWTDACTGNGGACSRWQALTFKAEEKLEVSKFRSKAQFLRKLADDSGQDLIEYCLIAAIVVTVAAAALPSVSAAIAAAYGKLTAAISAA